MKLLLVAMIAVCIAGCAPDVEPKAAADFGCTPEQIVVENQYGGSVKKVSGCGRLDVYEYSGSTQSWIPLTDRAAFEMDCDKSALKLTILDGNTFGVAGCNQRVVYKYVWPQGFFLDSGREKAQPVE